MSIIYHGGLSALSFCRSVSFLVSISFVSSSSLFIIRIAGESIRHENQQYHKFLEEFVFRV